MESAIEKGVGALDVEKYQKTNQLDQSNEHFMPSPALIAQNGSNATHTARKTANNNPHHSFNQEPKARRMPLQNVSFFRTLYRYLPTAKDLEIGTPQRLGRLWGPIFAARTVSLVDKALPLGLVLEPEALPRT